MSYIEKQAEEEDCEPCRFAVGIGITVNICKELKKSGKDIDCEDLEKAVKDETITVKEFVEQIGERIKNTGDKDQYEVFDEVRELMFKKQGLA